MAVVGTYEEFGGGCMLLHHPTPALAEYGGAPEHISLHFWVAYLSACKYCSLWFRGVYWTQTKYRAIPRRASRAPRPF